MSNALIAVHPTKKTQVNFDFMPNKAIRYNINARLELLYSARENIKEVQKQIDIAYSSPFPSDLLPEIKPLFARTCAQLMEGLQTYRAGMDYALGHEGSTFTRWLKEKSLPRKSNQIYTFTAMNQFIREEIKSLKKELKKAEKNK